MPPILTSENDLILRPARYGDGSAYLTLGWSAEIHRMFGGSRTTPPENPRLLAANWLRSIRASAHAWVIDVDGRLIGQIRLHSVDRTDLSARLSVGILTEDVLGRGIGRRAIQLVLAHAFKMLALNRVDLRVIEFNERAIRCYRSCGFVEEGRARQSAHVGGVFYDDIMMGIVAKEFHALENESRG